MSVIFTRWNVPRSGILACLPVLFACTAGNDGGADNNTAVACTAPAAVDTLPSALSEASGIAVSFGHLGILWAHNDSESPALFAIDTLGRVVARIALDAATRAPADWEDIAIADCGGRDCLYIADIGDNYHVRDALRILRLPEPDPGRDTSFTPTAFPVRYPDGAHDAEALFVLPGERIHVITKGRDTAAALYRYPGELRNEVVTLERVQSLSDGVLQLPDMITGASATRDGRFVAVRTYHYLRLMEWRDDSLVPTSADTVPLQAAHEFQGEGVGMGDSGDLFLVGERGFDGRPAPYSRMRCTLPRGTIPAP